MTNSGNQEAARAFAGAFAEALQQELTRTAGRPWQVKVPDSPDLNTRQGQPIHYRLTLDGALRGLLFIELYEQQVKELVSKISGEVVSAFDQERGNDLGELILAAGIELSASLAAQRGAFTCAVEVAHELSLGSMLPIPLSVFEADEPPMAFTLYFEGQLLSALAGPPQAAASPGRPKAALDPLNLDLVLDVELNVSLRFGQRQLPLHEVLELVSGSVVELDRQVDDPVELLLDGKVIARGEAVIVDGNYGLRVTEIPQPIATHLTR
jgi:flagellar motor switch protein FliN/FliY